MRVPQRLIFGIYPGGAAGSDTGLVSGPPDEPALVNACLDGLQGSVEPFVVRAYDTFQDPGSALAASPCAPVKYEQYASPRRPLELVLQYRSASGDVPGYLQFVRMQIEKHHRYLYSVQITEEANFAGGPPVIDGGYPDVQRALVEGVRCAKETLAALGSGRVKVGFNATPTFGAAAGFWSALRDLGGQSFVAALDFVGLDFFPDVFRPLAPDGEPGDLVRGVGGVLATMRNEWLPSAGIPAHVPIHVTENGWPTGPDRSEARQAAVVEKVVRAIEDAREALNVGRYMHFALRDAQVAQPGAGQTLFHFFGLTRADYSRKPAFDVFRGLIQELG
jgi:hypothetical protein